VDGEGLDGRVGSDMGSGRTRYGCWIGVVLRWIYVTGPITFPTRAMDAVVNQQCPVCSQTIAVESDQCRVTRHDADDDSVRPGVCRISVVWSCPNCQNLSGHTWYSDGAELRNAMQVPWVGVIDGRDTYISVESDQHSEIEADSGQLRRGGSV
jgi:hypothetical protein